MSANQYSTVAFSKAQLPVTEVEIPIVTPEMYGAKGDGVTDDTAAFQAALNFLGNTRPGPLTLGLKDYLINTGPIVLPRGCGLKGVAGLGGVFASEGNTGIATRFLNTSNNHTVQVSNLNTYVDGIIFAAPQPVFEASVSDTGTIQAVGVRYSGFNLTPGTYNLIFDGGFGTGAAGTATIGSDGQWASCAITSPGSGYLGPSGAAGGLAVPRTRVIITGGNQTGAHIIVQAGADMWQVTNCCFLSKDFNILCNENHIVTQCSGSYNAAAQRIPIADTSAFQQFMVINNPSNPQSLRQFNLISGGGVGSNFINMSFGVDAGSLGASDTIIAGLPIYFLQGQILNCSFFGSTYWQVYMNTDAENVNIHDCVFINPEGGAIFQGSGLSVTFERNNIDGIFGPHGIAAQFISPPRSIRDNAIGNVTGNTDVVGTGLYINGRLVFGGAITPAALVCEGNQIYAPMCRALWLESVTGALFQSNLLSTYDPTDITGCYDLVTDSVSIGNTFIYGADAGPNVPSYWNLGSQQNWIIGPWGKQNPYRKVTADDTFGPYDHTIAADATGGAITLNLPLSTTLTASQAGLEFRGIKLDNSGNAVTMNGNADNINGSPTLALSNQFDFATLERSYTAMWHIVGSYLI